jgi:tetratricopeptide (TPR) repeat protein
MLLGYATAGISQYASFAFLYITILAAVSGVLLVGMNWQTVAVFSLLGTYLTHLLWLRPYQAIPPDRAEFWVNAGFLAAYWTIYNGVSLFVKTYDEREKNWSAAFALANSLLFGVICFMQVRAYNAAWKVPFALASAAILLAFGAVSASAKDKPHVRSAFFVAAIAFATVSVRFTAGKTAAYFIWLMEIPVLLAAGFYLKSVFYRFGAWVLSLIMLLGMLVSFGIPDERVIYRGKEMPLVLFLYLTAITCFYLARYVYIARPALSKCHENELRFSNLYTVLASAALLGVSYYEIQTKLVTLTWSASALFLFMIGFFAKDKIFRYSAIGVVAVSLLRGVTVDLAGINTAYRIILFICLGLVLLGVSFWYAKASAAAEGGKAAGGAGMRWAALAIMPLVAASVLAAAYRYPSDFRKMGEMNAKEAEITARFMAGKDLSADDTAFLRERKFRSLEQTLRGLPLGKDGARLEIHLHAVAMGLESMDVYRKLGRYYAEIDKKDKALEMYEKGIALDPQAKQWETRDMVRQAAKLSKDTGDYRKAAAYYERYLTFSKNVLDLYELAVCYKNLGDLDKALEKLNEAVRMDQRGMYSSELNSLKSDIYGRKKVLEEKASPKKSPARK